MENLRKGDRITFASHLREMRFAKQEMPFREFISAKMNGRKVWISAQSIARVSRRPKGLQETLWYLYHQNRGLLRLAIFLRGRTLLCTDVQFENHRMSDGTLRRIKYPVLEIE